MALNESNSGHDNNKNNNNNNNNDKCLVWIYDILP